MNLSPAQKQRVIETISRMGLDELRAELGGSFQSLLCMDLTTATKMTGLSKPTLRANLPVVELSEGKHGVRVSDLNAYLKLKTVNPKRERSGV